MSIRHGHSSGRYDRSPDSLAAQVGRYTADGSPANLLTFTEVGHPDRAERVTADGWGRYVPDSKTDCGILWLAAEWSPVHKAVKRLTDKTWKDGQGNTHHQDATTVVLDHKSGKRLWLSLIHLPSGVQNGNQFSDKTTHVNAWKGAVRGWADYHRQQAKSWDPDLTMYVADWNVDHRSGHWRDYLGDVYPNCRPTWRKDHLPKDGTHGNRLIDCTWTDGKFKWTGLLEDDNSSDHRPYGEEVGWP